MPQEEFREEAELRNGKVRCEGGLFAFFADDADACIAMRK